MFFFVFCVLTVSLTIMGSLYAMLIRPDFSIHLSVYFITCWSNTLLHPSHSPHLSNNIPNISILSHHTWWTKVMSVGVVSKERQSGTASMHSLSIEKSANCDRCGYIRRLWLLIAKSDRVDTFVFLMIVNSAIIVN